MIICLFVYFSYSCCNYLARRQWYCQPESIVIYINMYISIYLYLYISLSLSLSLSLYIYIYIFKHQNKLIRSTGMSENIECKSYQYQKRNYETQSESIINDVCEDFHLTTLTINFKLVKWTNIHQLIITVCSPGSGCKKETQYYHSFEFFSYWSCFILQRTIFHIFGFI